MWVDSFGNDVQFDDIKKTVSNPENMVYIGTDSHAYGGIWLFATVICCHVPGRGGRFYTKRIKILRDEFRTLPERLIHEAYLSISAAQEVEEHCYNKPKIHVDISKKGNGSAKSYSVVSSYVLGMGYDVMTKPDAWASSSVADRQAR